MGASRQLARPGSWLVLAVGSFNGAGQATDEPLISRIGSREFWTTAPRFSLSLKMGSRVDEIVRKQLLPKGAIPTWLQKAVQYEVITGSYAYGASGGTSDMDIYGWAIPPREYIFPHTAGYLVGFERVPTFDQWQMHHVIDPTANQGAGQEYDFSIYGIFKYFRLCMDCNPNMIDSLFVPGHCIVHCTPVAGLVRQNRDRFLSKQAYHKFNGYLHAQMAKLDRKPEGKRVELVEKYGFDVKFAYHAVRLGCQLEQVLETGTMDLCRDKEMYKAIRRGEWSIDQIRKYVFEKQQRLERLYEKSKMRTKPDKVGIKQLLLDCLEQHFGSLSQAEVANPDKYRLIVQQIAELVGNAGTNE